MRVFKPQSPFLSGFTASEREALLAAATRRRFKPAAVITRHGEPGRDEDVSDRERACPGTCDDTRWSQGDSAVAGAGRFVGRRDTLASAITYRASSEALRETEVLVWDRAAIRKLAECYPRVLENALQLASSYVDWNLASHIALSSQTAQQRLAGVLVSLVPLLGHRVPEGIEFEITNEELSSAAHVSVFTTSRLLNGWQRQRALTKHRGKIVSSTRGASSIIGSNAGQPGITTFMPGCVSATTARVPPAILIVWSTSPVQGGTAERLVEGPRTRSGRPRTWRRFATEQLQKRSIKIRRHRCQRERRGK